jgi:hypothetical protein
MINLDFVGSSISSKMPFMRGVAPIRRTMKYLESGPLVFKDRVKIMTVNYSEKNKSSTRLNFDHHKGAQVKRETFCYFRL